MMDYTRDLLSYIDESPTPWHCAETSARRLDAAGFTRLDERSPWDLKPGDGAYFIRDGALFAFRLGLDAPQRTGFRVLGAHTDSPNLRLKLNPALTKGPYASLGVETYGGLIYHSWLDRDLGLSGRIFTKEDGLAPKAHLIDLRQPLARIPAVAIHLDREVNEKGPRLNPQTQLAPLFAMADTGDPTTMLRKALADAAQVEADRILGWDLCLVDTQPSAIGGLHGDFIFAPRLDNQASCHAGLVALIESQPSQATQVLALYDHEEVGSLTTAGADGPLLAFALTRIANLPLWGDPKAPETETLQRAISQSWQISADMAHAVHPNYPDRHEPEHKPVLNAGPVIKSNQNQRYATTGETVAYFEALAQEAGVAIQYFVNRNDLRCGTTIGPISSGKLGIRTIDVGNPMLSMHSVREQAGSRDVAPMIRILHTFFEKS